MRHENNGAVYERIPEVIFDELVDYIITSSSGIFNADWLFASVCPGKKSDR